MSYDSWQNQGRQEHGWFGHGTSPHDDKPGRPNPPAPDAPEQRATVASYGAIAHLKRDLARPYEIALHYGMNGDFQKLVAAHPATASLDDEAYHAEILDGRLTQPQVAHLRDAVALTHGARTLDDLDPAAKAMGSLVVSAGLHNTRNALATAAAASADYRPPPRPLPKTAASALAMGTAAALPLTAEGTAAALLAGVVSPVMIIPLLAVAVLAAYHYGLFEMMPEYDPDLIGRVDIEGHPELQAVLDQRQMRLALAVRDRSGAPVAAVAWKAAFVPQLGTDVYVPPPMLIYTDDQGREMGRGLLSEPISLTEAGTKALQEAAQNGPKIAPRDEEERRLVDGWTAEGRTPLEIQILLDAHQNSQGGTEAEQSDATADPAKAAVEKRTPRFREQVLAADKKVADAIARGDLKPGDVAAHHVIPIASAGKKTDEFVAGGWKSNDVENGIMLPTNPTAQRKLKKLTGEKRPIHRGGHKDYIKEVDEEVQEMIKKVEKGAQQGTPEYGAAMKEGLRGLVKKMRGKLLGKGKMAMIEESHEGIV